jgi:hypothetical protein
MPLYFLTLVHLRRGYSIAEALRHPKSSNSLGILQLRDYLGYCGDVVEVGEVGVAG